MFPLFLISLGIIAACVLISTVFQDSTGEARSFAIVVAIGSVVLALISAPWELQLVLLLVLLSKSQWLAAINFAFSWGKSAQSPATAPLDAMMTPTAVASASPVTHAPLTPDVEESTAGASDQASDVLVCKYRGAAWTPTLPEEAPPSPPIPGLKYRGTAIR